MPRLAAGPGRIECVMGGTCQRTYEHAIPKVAQAGARIALMYRPVWREDQASHSDTSE